MHPVDPDRYLRIAATYGLPLFVYDAAIIKEQITALQEAFDVPGLDIRFACKAQTNSSILQYIAGFGCGIDTVSPGEMSIALMSGVDPSKISFTPSGVLPAEYEFALSHKIHVHVDQVEMLHWLDEHYPGTAITLRFNPGIRAGGHEKLQVGSDDSKFGIPTAQVSEIVRLTKHMSLRIIGVHMHLGSDIGDSASFDAAYDYLLTVARHWSATLEHVDLGGGFKIPYHPEDHSIDILSFGKKVSERFRHFKEDMGRNIKLVLEPGKFLVSASGVLLMEVTSVRDSSSYPMVFVQSGFNHFLRPMNYGAYHHIVNISNPDGEIKKYNVVGYLCETDTFASHRQIAEIRRGDILCLMNAGAYGYTMASNYNSRPKPAEVMVNGHETHLIRRAETIEDLIKTDTGLVT